MVVLILGYALDCNCKPPSITNFLSSLINLPVELWSVGPRAGLELRLAYEGQSAVGQAEVAGAV